MCVKEVENLITLITYLLTGIQEMLPDFQVMIIIVYVFVEEKIRKHFHIYYLR